MDEYQCVAGGQCIPASYQCDGEIDCQDRSDEIGCGRLSIIVLLALIINNYGNIFSTRHTILNRPVLILLYIYVYIYHVVLFSCYFLCWEHTCIVSHFLATNEWHFECPGLQY